MEETTRDEKYPLYPLLNEAGQKEAEEIIEAFKKKLSKAAEEAIGDLYVNIGCYVESDSWTNYRQSLLSGLCNYSNSKEYRYDFEKIRESIYKNFREDIIKDLNQDNLKEIDRLKEALKFERECRERRY